MIRAAAQELPVAIGLVGHEQDWPLVAMHVTTSKDTDMEVSELRLSHRCKRFQI